MQQMPVVKMCIRDRASDDRSILAQRLNISPHPLSYVTNYGEGEGLLFYGNVILPVSYTHLDVYKRQGHRLCNRADWAPE